MIGKISEAIYTTLSCCLPLQTIRVNNRTFKLLKLLGEGLVYLVQDITTGRLYALKRIHCSDPVESVAEALREAEMYRMFDHPNIINVLDVCVTQSKEGNKVVFIFLPYYKNGNLHDIIYKKQADMNDLTASAFTEVQLLRIFRGICYAVQGMHQYRLPQVPTTREGESAHMHRNPYYASRSSKDDPSRSLLRPGGNGGEEEEETYAESEVSDDNIVAYAHRDIKPGNVLIGDDGATPILTDFGSMSRAKIDIRTRQQAAMEQDRAAEQCSMAYRAPELFDIRPGTTLSEKVDIWSLGCLLYAMAYGMSPFETNLQHGGSIALAVQNGRYTFPAQNSRYSEGLKDIIKAMLVVDPNDRPDISQIIGAVETLLQKISNMHS